MEAEELKAWFDKQTGEIQCPECKRWAIKEDWTDEGTSYCDYCLCDHFSFKCPHCQMSVCDTLQLREEDLHTR